MSRQLNYYYYNYDDLGGRSDVGVSDSPPAPPKPAGQNVKRQWGATSNTSKYVTPPCRPVQTKRSCRRRLAIHRYPLRLNNLINCRTTGRSYPNLTSKLSFSIAHFAVAVDWKLVRVVRRRLFDDDRRHGNSFRR